MTAAISRSRAIFLPFGIPQNFGGPVRTLRARGGSALTLDTNSANSANRNVRVPMPVPGTYEVDPTRSYIGFSVRNHMVSSVRGQFRSFRGALTVAHDPAGSGLALEIDTASIDTADAERDERLRSADYLDVDRYPTMPYRSRRVWPVASLSA